MVSSGASKYHALEQHELQAHARPKAIPSHQLQDELAEAEHELLKLLKARGVRSICESITKEINYVWAVLSGFRTLASVGHFYAACGSQTFGYNPAVDFFEAHGMQIAVFVLQKFVHNEHVLVPVLDSIQIFTKLHVDGALEFLAVADSIEILLKCVRFHDNKPKVISTACHALGSLVMNDLVKETLSYPALVLELLGLVKRYDHNLAICRAALVPLGFLVTDERLTASFVDGNGIALAMMAMKRFLQDTELVWHAIGILNGLNARTLDVRVIYSIFQGTGISRIVEAVAAHLDTEEITVEGFQLLARLGALPDAYASINHCKVLDLAYVALFAYSGPQHRHTRVEIKRSMRTFHKCTLFDPHELAQREQASRLHLVLYTLFVLVFALASVFPLYDTQANDLSRSIERALLNKAWPNDNGTLSSLSERHSTRTMQDVSSVSDVWSFLQGPLIDTLFQTQWYNGDLFALEGSEQSQLGVVDRSHVLLGGLQLRLLRVESRSCVDSGQDNGHCYPPYAQHVESKQAQQLGGSIVDSWFSGNSSQLFPGRLASYPSGGYHQFIPRLSSSTISALACGPYCQLAALKKNGWIDPSARALFLEFNLYNPWQDIHCAVTILFEFASTGGVLSSSRVTPIHLDSYPGQIFLFSERFYLELGLLVGLLWFAHKQIDKLLRYRLFYFSVASHLVDFAIVVLWAAVLATRLSGLALASHSLVLQLAQNDSFVSLDDNAEALRTEKYLTGWCGVLMWWRLLRLARCLKPLERTFAKFERAESLLASYGGMLVLYVLGFAQTALLLFPTSSSSSVANFRSLSVAIATMATHLLRRFKPMDMKDEDDQSPSRTLLGFRLVFHFATTFVVLHIAVVIMRERFDSTRDRLQPEESKAGSGSELLARAKQQLTASGLQVQDHHSTQSKLRVAAARGLEKLQQATREIFAISDQPVELTNLKEAWGLMNHDEDSDDAGESDAKRQEELSALMQQAEEFEAKLGEQINLWHLRLQDLAQKLQLVEQHRARVREKLREIEEHERWLMSAYTSKRDDDDITEAPSSRPATSPGLASPVLEEASPPVLLPGAVAVTSELEQSDDESDEP